MSVFIFIIYVAAAILPAILLLVYVYSMDKIEPEPMPFVIRLLFMGILAAVISIFLEDIGDGLIRFLASDQTIMFVTVLTFLMVGAVEEGTKYIMLRTQTWKNSNFDYKFDGLVYAVSVSLGFAIFENVSYVFRYGLAVAGSRAVLAVPAHMAFSVAMGIFYSKAKFYRNRGREQTSRLCSWLSWLVPVGLHGLYETLATLRGTTATVLYISFVVAMYVVMFFLIRYESKHDEHL